MTARARRAPPDIPAELLAAFERSGRVSEYLVSILPSGLWRMLPPGEQGRTIAEIFAHMQSVRRAWLTGTRRVPARLDHRRATPRQTQRALRASTDGLLMLLRSGVEGTGRVARDVSGWSVSGRAVDLCVYLIAHDAHHRGQICSLARRLGHRLSQDEVMRLWGWKKLET